MIFLIYNLLFTNLVNIIKIITNLLYLIRSDKHIVAKYITITLSNSYTTIPSLS